MVASLAGDLSGSPSDFFDDGDAAMRVGDAMVQALPNRILALTSTIHEGIAGFEVPADGGDGVAFGYAFDGVFTALIVEALGRNNFYSDLGFGSDYECEVFRAAQVSVGHFQSVGSQIGEFGFVDPQHCP